MDKELEKKQTKETIEQTVEAEPIDSAAEPTVSEMKEEESGSEQETEVSEEKCETLKDAKKPKQESQGKKIIGIIIAAAVVVGLVIGGVVIAKNGGISKKQAVTLEDGSPAPDSQEGIKQGHSESAEVITGEQATEKAKVKSADAIELIKSYSDEQLGLKKDDYTFMIAQQAYVIGGESYVQVIAAEKQENADGTFSITPHGKYYISFDGETVLKENMEKPGEYEKI